MRTLWFGLLIVAIPAVTAAQDARAIVTEVQKRARAESQQYEGVLQVVDSGGKIADKRWIYERLGSHGRSKAIIRFLGPAEVKDVALLILNYPDRSADQWMWTPAINRERRIAVQDRRTRFFGTDFSFEDLEERDVEQFDYVLLGEQEINGELCWQIESRPRAGKRSQYTRSVLWIRKEQHTYARIDNYVNDALVRQIDYGEMTNVQGIWTARRIEVRDVTRDSRTILRLDSLKYNVPLREDQFTVAALRRG